MRAMRKPDGPLVRFLLDPEAALRALVGWLADALPILLLALGLLGAGALGWRLWIFRRDRRLMQEARRIRVLSPTEIDPVGARTLWMGLHALLRPWWRRLLWGQPYLAWEIVATSEDVEVSVQVPKVVPDGLVGRAPGTARVTRSPGWASNGRSRRPILPSPSPSGSRSAPRRGRSRSRSAWQRSPALPTGSPRRSRC
jgi:hypothetical protein